MDSTMGRQSIRCNVKSCTYNNCNQSCCDLKSIQVEAKPGGTTGTGAGESLCASYKTQG